MVIAIVFGLFFGIVAALNRGKPLDYLTIVLVIVGVSVPSFVVAGVLQYWLGVHLKVLPVARYETVWHTIMPSFALGLGTMAVIARYMRASMLEIVNADYIRTARAKGLRRSQIVWRHQIRNAIFPILTILGPTIASVLTGSFVIESIFAIPGLGRHFVLAMQNLDYTLVLGLTVFFGVFLIAHEFSRRRRLRPDRPAHSPFLHDAMMAARDPSLFLPDDSPTADVLAGRPSVAFWSDVWRRFRPNIPAMVGVAIVGALRSSRRVRADDVALQLRAGRPALHLPAAECRALVRHRRARPRHLVGDLGRRARVADGRPRRGARADADRLVIGCYSGLHGGRVDMAIMRFVDIMIAIPFLIWVSLIVLVLSRASSRSSSPSR